MKNAKQQQEKENEKTKRKNKHTHAGTQREREREKNKKDTVVETTWRGLTVGRTQEETARARARETWALDNVKFRIVCSVCK